MTKVNQAFVSKKKAFRLVPTLYFTSCCLYLEFLNVVSKKFNLMNTHNVKIADCAVPSFLAVVLFYVVFLVGSTTTEAFIISPMQCTSLLCLCLHARIEDRRRHQRTRSKEVVTVEFFLCLFFLQVFCLSSVATAAWPTAAVTSSCQKQCRYCYPLAVLARATRIIQREGGSEEIS